MAISINTAGSWAFVASGSITVTLPTHATGNMLICRVSYKSSAISTALASTATAGWAKIGTEFHNGTTNSGNGIGSVAVAAFWKVATSGSETNPQIDFSQTITQAGAVAVSYQKASNETWDTPRGDGGGDTSSGTGVSATIQSHVTAKNADMTDFFIGIADDTTMTVPTFTQASLTLAAVSEQPATAGIVTTGDDMAFDGGYRLATAGTSSAAAVVTGTLSTAETGSAWVTVMHVYIAGSFTADATIRTTVSPTLTANAVVFRTQSASFSADAAKAIMVSAGFTADSAVLRTQPASVSADAVVFRTISASFTANAFIQPFFTADAVLRIESYPITADATVLRPFSGSIASDATLLEVGSATFSANAVLFQGAEAALTANAVIAKTESAAIVAEAILLQGRTVGLGSDAVLLSLQGASFTANCWIGTPPTEFTADAVIAVKHSKHLSAKLDPVSIPRIFATLGWKRRTRQFTADAELEV